MSNEKDTSNCPRYKRYKSQSHLVEMYLDSDEWQEAYNKLLEIDNVAYIHHNKDNCKEHIHALVITENQTYNTALAKRLGIEAKWIEQVRDREKACKYLIHLGWNDKHQYDESEVMFTSDFIKDVFNKAVNKPVGESEDMRVCRLLDLLDGQPKLNYSHFLRLACENGLYDVLRRNSYMMCKILAEHNAFVAGGFEGGFEK